MTAKRLVPSLEPSNDAPAEPDVGAFTWDGDIPAENSGADASFWHAAASEGGAFVITPAGNGARSVQPDALLSLQPLPSAPADSALPLWGAVSQAPANIWQVTAALCIPEVRPAARFIAPAQAAPSQVSAVPAAILGDPADEITYISGITADAKVAATSYWTWNDDDAATYDSTYSYAAKWGGTALSGSGTAGGNVTYWFDTSSRWSATEKNALASGLALWSAEANITFSQAASSTSAKFVFYRGYDGSAYTSSRRQSTAIVGSGTDGAYASRGTRISIDTSVPGFGPIGSFSAYGGYSYGTLVHEQGHMLGLGHGGPYNGDVTESTQQFSAYDSLLWSLMSYIGPETASAKYYSGYPVTGTKWRGYEATTPMMLDILAIQRIYGEPVSGPLVDGGQTFGFHCNVSGLASRYFDFTVNTHPVITIWDGGTGNTLDLSGFSSSAVISLTPGTFSSCGGLVNNIGIALNTTIENAVGGSGNDRITGTGDNNLLNGGLGADRMTGGSGDDTYVIDNAGDVADETGGDGSDTLQLSVSYSLSDTVHALGDIENLTLTGSAAINGTGNAFDNVITGNAGSNVIAGLGGADTLDGGGGTDTVTYAASAAGIAVSLMTGQCSGGDAEGDTLLGFENLTGTAFADTLEGGAGASVLAGGAGIDTLTYENATARVTVNLSVTSAQSTGGSGSDTLSGFENLTGSGYGDTLTGTSGVNVLTGLAGNDTLNGGGGADYMTGGEGNDFYVVDNAGDVADESGAGGIDTVQSAITFSLSDGSRALGEIENLTLTGGSAINGTGTESANIITGNGANNRLTGLGGGDLLDGGAGADRMIGGGGDEFYIVDNSGDVADETGGEGNDSVASAVSFSLSDAVHAMGEIERLTLTGTAAINGTGNALDNVITGNTGANILAGQGGADTLTGGAGIDTATYAASVSAVDVSLMTGACHGGDAEGDIISGFENLTGSAGGDTLEGDTGNNVLTAGAGTDTLTYEHAVAGVTASLASGRPQNTGGSGSDTVSGFENLTGSAFNDTLTGTSAANVLIGLDGADTLNGGGGADYMAGGEGADTYVVDNAGDVADESSGGGIDTVQSSVSFSLSDDVHALGEIENLTLTGSSSVNGTGNGLDNFITGNSGANILTGLDGADTLTGGGGADRMFGGTGDDIYGVDNTGDIVSEDGGSGTDTVQSSVSFSLSDAVHAVGEIENLTLAGTGAINGTGNALDNIITGNAGSNILAGLGGADTLTGGAGSDTASYAASESAVDISLATSVCLGGDAEGDTLIGIENLTGSAFDDLLEGSAGNSVLNGGAGIDTVSYAHIMARVTVSLAATGTQNTGGGGSDRLSGFENLIGTAFNDVLTGNAGANVMTGGAGNDTLRGSAGTDTFVFDQPDDGFDTIADFLSGTDLLRLSAAGFGGGLSGGQAPELVTAASAAAASGSGGDGYFIFVNSGTAAGTLYWDATGAGGDDATALLKVQAGATIRASDFFIA